MQDLIHIISILGYKTEFIIAIACLLAIGIATGYGVFTLFQEINKAEEGEK